MNQYFPPDASATATVFSEIASTLKVAGHDVTIICGHPSYNPTQSSPWRLFRKLTSSVGTVYRVGSSAFSRHSLAGRATNYFSFLVLGGITRLLSRRPDITIVGSDPPLAIVLAVLGARKKPTIYALQDLHPDLGVASGWITEGLISRIWDAVHTWATRRATKVVCLGQSMAHRLIAKGIDSEKVVVIPHGTPSRVFPPSPHLTTALREESHFLVVHAGNIGWAGAWQTIIDAWRILKDEVGFLFVGNGVKAHQVRHAGMRVVPYHPESELGSVMAAGDLQLVTVKPGAEGLVVPSKMYTLLAYGRPMLVVAPKESEVAHLAERGAGIVADPLDPLDMVEKVRWARQHPEELAKMSAHASALAGQIRRDDQLRKFVDLVQQLAGQE